MSDLLRIYAADEVLKLEAPTFVINDLIVSGSFTEMYGPSGVGKSFVALAMAGAIATGKDFADFPTKSGQVLYIAAEGKSGFQNRIRAWQIHNDICLENAWFIFEEVSLLDEAEVTRLKESVISRRIKPELIVIDTLARCLGDGDENTARDMSRFVKAVDGLRREFCCAALIIHHSGKDQRRGERGSSALRAAADCVIEIERKDNQVTLTCIKQKDAKPFESVILDLVNLNLENCQSSCVLRSGELEVRSKGGLVASERLALQQLANVGSATYEEWKQLCREKSESTFNRARKLLLDEGYVHAPDGGQKGAKYFLTEKGREAVTVT